MTVRGVEVGLGILISRETIKHRQSMFETFITDAFSMIWKRQFLIPVPAFKFLIIL